MEQFVEFVGNHMMLFVATTVVLVLLIHNLVSTGGKDTINPQQATDLINREEAVVLDVRPMNDYAAGHIINSRNIPLNALSKQLHTLDKFKQQPVIVTCRSGAQSGGACKTLRKEGFEKVYNLQGGVLAWQSANLPISKKKR